MKYKIWSRKYVWRFRLENVGHFVQAQCVKSQSAAQKPGTKVYQTFLQVGQGSKNYFVR